MGQLILLTEVVVVLYYLRQALFVLLETVVVVDLSDFLTPIRPLVEDSVRPQDLLEIDDLLILLPILLDLLICEQEFSHVYFQLVAHSESFLIFW